MMDFTLTLQSSAETTEKVTEQNTAIRYASGTAPVCHACPGRTHGTRRRPGR